MAKWERMGMLLGLLVIAAGTTGGNAQSGALRGPGDCPMYACPGLWDAECGQNNSPQAICAAAGCGGDLHYSQCSPFADCDGPMGARCISV